MKHWYIRFKNFQGSLCTINIYDNDYSGSPIELTGSSDVFSTSEESSDYALDTLRYSTGYINITDIDGKYDAFPVNDTQYYVELINGTTTLWQGFIQSQSLDGDIYDKYHNVQIPVVDALGVMDSIKMEDDNYYDLTPIGTYITEAIDKVKDFGADIDSVIFPQEWHEKNKTDYGFWFKLNCSRFNFVDKDEKPYTYLSIISSIAEAFGWVVSLHRKSIVFQSMRDNCEYMSSSISDIKSFCSGSTTTLTVQTISSSSIDIDSSQSVSSSNDIVINKGVGSVSVIVDSNEKESGIEMQNEGLVFKQYVTDDIKGYRILEFNDNKDFFETYSSKIYGPTSQYQPTYPYACIDNNSYGTEQGYVRTFMAMFDTTPNEDKKSYEYKSGFITMYKIPVYTQSGIEKICPIKGQSHLFDMYGGNLAARPDGCIDISFKGYNAGGTGTIYNAFKFAIKIGNYWIKKEPFNDGYSFSSERCFVDPTWETDNNFGFKLQSNKTKDLLYKDAENLCIPTHRYGVQSCGKIFVEFWLDCDRLNDNAWPCNERAYFYFNEIYIKYCPSEYEYLSGIGTREHKEETSSENIPGEKTITPKICTKFDDIEDGFAVLFNGTESLKPGDMVNESGHTNIEKALHDEMVRCYIGKTTIASPSIRALPESHSSSVSMLSNTYHILSTETNWRDCTTKYNLCKMQS